MKSTLFILSLCIICLMQITCEREPIAIPSNLPFNVLLPEATFNVDEIKVTKATVKAAIGERGNLNILGYGCAWDTMPNPSIEAPGKIEFDDLTTDTFSIVIPGLEENTRYYVRVFLIFAKDTIYLEQKEFTTLAHWVQMPNYPGLSSQPAAFFINGLVYAGAGFFNKRDFWVFDPGQLSWNQKDQFFSSAGLNGVSSFAINKTGYFIAGANQNGRQRSFSAYKVLENEWIALPDFPGPKREAAVAFSIKGKGYIGTGEGEFGMLNDFWEYDTLTMTWEEIDSFPGPKRFFANAFVIDDKAYVCFGRNNVWLEYNDIWQFDPSKPEGMRWREMKQAPLPRSSAFAFAAGKYGYVGYGVNRLDFWKFDPNVPPKGEWQMLNSPLPTGRRSYSTSVSLGDRGLVIGGRDASELEIRECWIFNPE